jgi:hypothetical protein
MAAYRAALTVRTREHVPLQWALTQSNLGNALRNLGEREAGIARLEEAVAAYRAALTVMTRERVPLQWALTTGDQGVAFIFIAERIGDAALAHRAILQIDLALRIMRDGADAPSAANFSEQLAKARALFDRLSKQRQ